MVKIGTFGSEKDFLKSAVEDKVWRWELLKLNTIMDKFAEQIIKKRPESVTEVVLKTRTGEDEIL